MNKNEPRVLIISHLAVNKTNNVGKTLALLFKGFGKENLIQLYFTPTPPGDDLCKSWFCITDRMMLKSLKGKAAGLEVAYIEKKGEFVANLPKVFNRKGTFTLLARDLLWLIGRYNKKNLYDWVDKYRPQVIFLAPGQSVFAYRIAIRIAERFKLPIVFFIMDDYYNENKNPYNPLELLRKYWLAKTIKKCIQISKKIFVVSEEMAQEYHCLFKKDFDVLFTPIDVSENVVLDKNDSDIYEFIYAGNIGLNRWKVLKKLGKCLEKSKCRTRLTIYCSDEYVDELTELTTVSTIKYGGFITAEKLNEKIHAADAVVHVESFDKLDMKRTRFSISTKVPECMNSGKLFLVIGPEGQASVEYVRRNNIGVVCTSEADIQETVNQILQNRIDLAVFRDNAKKILQRNHTQEAIHNHLLEGFINVIK